MLKTRMLLVMTMKDDCGAKQQDGDIAYLFILEPTNE